MSDEPKRRAQKTFRDPLVYAIGTDISQEQYEELLIKVGEWFAQSLTTREPMAEARRKIKCCLEGTTLDGQKWYNAWNSSFEKRMKMLCRFDVTTMTPLLKTDEKTQARKQKAREKEAAKRQTAANDPLIPPLTKAGLNKSINYGTKAIPVTEDEANLWQRIHHAYTEQFPELKTVNAEAELAMLVDLHVVHERNRLKLIKGERVDPVAMASNTKLMTDLKKAMGIHPEQLIKRTAGDSKATIADAAGKFDAMPPALRDQMWLEELLLLFQQYHTPSPREDGDGYQLDDIGLFGQTRCRTCACSKCGQKNFVGINIDEVTDYLAKKGTLEELEPEPPVTIVDIPVSDMADDELSSDA